MNCKQGDLAVIVVGPNAGTFVRCLRFQGYYLTRLIDGPEVRDGWWRTDKETRSCDGMAISRDCNDSILRPIRDNDGEDETLQWAGKPEQVVAC